MLNGPSKILAFVIGFSAFLAQGIAAPVISDIRVGGSTVSRVGVTSTTSGTTVTNTYTIFGANAGAVGGCQTGTSITSTCDSCTVLGNLNTLGGGSCSTTSIHPGLELKIIFKQSEIPPGASILAKVTGSAAGALNLNSVTSPLAANTDLSVGILWSELCNKASGVADCSLDFGVTLTVGLSTDADNFIAGTSQIFNVKLIYRLGTTLSPMSLCDATLPFCKFVVKAGDEKVYIQDIERGTLGPSGTSGVKWKSLRVYYAEGTGGSFAIPIGGSQTRYADFDILDQSSEKSSLSNNKITGLTNETSYMFTIATVDETTMVHAIKEATSLSNTDHVAKPGKVVGLLDDKKCFIATAAFGSPMAPQVEALRKFRNQFLLTSKWGQKFVKTYYQYSPPVAEFISEHESLRTLARWALWPLVSSANWLMSSNENIVTGGNKHE